MLLKFSSHVLFTPFVLWFSFLVAVSCEEKPILAKDMLFELNTGDRMPLVGFGTFRVRGAELVKTTLDLVIGSGYRLIDTAAVYRNEEEIGKALKELLPKYNLTRKDIFITTKLAPQDHGEKAYAALELSLKKLDCEYIDLYLIHTPTVRGANLSNSELSKLRDESWQQLVKGKKNGLTRNIGVSNYNLQHLTELLNNTHGVRPTVNQIKWNPKYHSNDPLDFLRKEGILLQAYSSLGGTDGIDDLLDNIRVGLIAERLGKTPAQVLLRWSVQQNIAVIPKALSQKHIEENIDLNFIIPEADMNTLNNFNRKQYAWNPDTTA